MSMAVRNVTFSPPPFANECLRFRPSLRGPLRLYSRNIISSSSIKNGELKLVATTGVTDDPHHVSVRIWNASDQHLFLLGAIACAVTGTISCMFLASIPTLLALKKAAESLERLADTAREELPGTMAAVRLSGMEISDLTMELSDLGQQITAGVKRSTKAVRAAEDGLRRMGGLTMDALSQGQMISPVLTVQPVVARTARTARNAIVRARLLLQNLIALHQFSGWVKSYFRWKLSQGRHG